MSQIDMRLLELAAKAEGRSIEYMTEIKPDGNQEKFIASWNPLTDDGDALRLAVKLNLFHCPEFFHYLALERFARQEVDDILANRRAIVRAAAEIGKVKP